jgi:hypothetical protein
MQTLAVTREDRTVTVDDAKAWYLAHAPDQAVNMVEGSLLPKVVFHPACGWERIDRGRWSFTGEDLQATAKRTMARRKDDGR